MTAIDERPVWGVEEPEEDDLYGGTPSSSGRVRYGVNATLEEAADEIIFGALRDITSREEKSDVLTPWKIKNRIGHEVYNASGFPDPSIRQGMYGRALNRAKPYLNSRDGLARAAARSEHSIALKHYTGTDSGPADG
jgi:hypothetical protein